MNNYPLALREHNTQKARATDIIDISFSNELTSAFKAVLCEKKVFVVVFFQQKVSPQFGKMHLVGRCPQ